MNGRWVKGLVFVILALLLIATGVASMLLGVGD